MNAPNYTYILESYHTEKQKIRELGRTKQCKRKVCGSNTLTVAPSSNGRGNNVAKGKTPGFLEFSWILSFQQLYVKLDI